MRIGYLLLRPQEPSFRLFRPVLALAICTLVLTHTQLSLMEARAFASETTSQVRQHCKTPRVCPMAIEGWQPRLDRYSSQTSHGRWVQWPILYHSDGKHFEVRLYKAMDVAESWTGSVNN